MVDNLIEWIEGDTPPEMNDSDRLDFLEDNQGCALVSDDDGRWVVACDGFQSVTAGEAADIETTFFIEKRFWKPTIREAIDAFREEMEVEE